MKLFLPALFLIILPGEVLSQSSDFLLLKRKSRTAGTYFSGSNIAFVTKRGAIYDGRIQNISKDTIYLQEFLTQRMLTTFGTIFLDTIGSRTYAINYNDVAVIGSAKKQKFNWWGSGASLLGGGTLLTIGSGIVYLVDNKKFSAPLMIASAGLAVLGYFMAKGRSDGITIGKKYRLQYMSTSSTGK